MDGRRPVGIMYTNTSVDHPTKEIEYNRWYHDVHFPDVTEPGIFVNALMFHNAVTPLPPGQGKFLAFYESFWPDLDFAYGEFSKTVKMLREQKRIHAGTAQPGLYGIYRQLSIHFSTQRRRRSQSVMAVMIDCKEKGKENDLKKWYNEKHVKEVVDLGIYHTGSFSQLITGEPFKQHITERHPNFMAIYESDIGDPQALAKEVGSRFPKNYVPSYVDIMGVSLWYRVSP